MDVSRVVSAVKSGLEIALPHVATIGKVLERSGSSASSESSTSFESSAREMQAMQEKHLQDQMRMQMLMEEYTHRSNMSKSLHDTSMAVLNNIRVR